jgi:hypothetical protein
MATFPQSKGKKGGKKGKGSNQSQQGKGSQNSWSDWGDQAWTHQHQRGSGDGWGGQWAAEEEEKSGNLRRITAKDSLAKKLLRPYADSTGSCIYTDGDDKAALSKTALRQSVNEASSELSRRPAWGFSMMACSVRALAAALQDADAGGARESLDKLFRGKAGKAVLSAMGEVDFERCKADPAAKEEMFEEILTFLKDNKKELYDLLAVSVSSAAKLYVGSVQCLDALVKADALGNWAEHMPEDEFTAEALNKWRRQKASPKTASEFLTAAYIGRRLHEASWKQRGGKQVRGDDSDDGGDDKTAEKKKEGKKKKQRSSTSSSDGDRKKKDKKSKKDRKKKKRARSSSSSSTEKPKKGADRGKKSKSIDDKDGPSLEDWAGGAKPDRGTKAKTSSKDKKETPDKKDKGKDKDGDVDAKDRKGMKVGNDEEAQHSKKKQQKKIDASDSDEGSAAKLPAVDKDEEKENTDVATPKEGEPDKDEEEDDAIEPTSDVPA